MARLTLSVCTFAVCSILGGAVVAQEGEQAIPEITEVDLGQSGVVLYTLTAEAEGDEPLALTVPVDHADDVLASLLVRDPAGGVVGIETPTPASVPEALRGTIFEEGIPGDTVELLEALTGVEITVVTEVDEITGTVLGIGEVEQIVDEELVEYPTVLLLTDEDGIAEVVLLPGTQVEIPDEFTEALAEAAQSRVGSADNRVFELSLDGTEDRQVEMTYVTEAPAWKNSWRLMLEDGRLQGWATLENTSGRDWDDVELTLSTGAPVAYSRNLLDPRRIGRLDPPNLVQARPDVRVDQGFAESAERLELGQQSRQGNFVQSLMADAVASAPQQETVAVSGGAREALAVEGIGNVRYTIPDAVELASGSTVNLLYLDIQVSPEIQALYQPDQSPEVLLAARLSADQPLAPGIVSVSDANGFVGDALFAGMTEGQSRLLPYASAPGAIVTQERSEEGVRVDLAATGGTLTLEVRRQYRTIYNASLPDSVDVFSVEHPKRGTQFLSADGEIEENARHVRVSQPVQGGGAIITVVEESVELRRLSVDSNGYRQAFELVTVGGAQLDDADQETFNEASDLMTSMVAAQRRLTDAEGRYQRLIQEQSRLRENLRAVQNRELRDRYEQGMGETENGIADALTQAEILRGEIATAESQLADIIGRFQ